MELVAPAGDLEKLEAALRYGADAVYCAGKEFGLRAHAGNLTLDEIARGVRAAHADGKRVFVAVNIFAHNADIDRLPAYIRRVREADVDAVIVSDPGVLDVVRATAPDLGIHLSTQANASNAAALRFWERQGVKRVVLGREVAATDIARMGREDGPEREMFVHGAMCLSYSGRCYISDYLTGRSANRGDCTHPCRWRYRLVEEQRPGEYFPVEEDDRGTYFMNSKDLCLIRRIPEITAAGVSAVKIEGRMKGVHYVAAVVRTYRAALNACAGDPAGYAVLPAWERELAVAGHREYTEGFWEGRPDGSSYRSGSATYVRGVEFVGKIIGVGSGTATVQVRNGFDDGDALEVVRPGFADDFIQTVRRMADAEEGVPVARANPNALLEMPFDRTVEPGDLLRLPVSS